MYLNAPGLVCSVGMGAEAACAAMRAGISQFDELPYRDNHGESIIGAAVLSLDPQLRRRERLVELLTLALADTLERSPSASLETVPLILCLAEPGRPGGGAAFGHEIITAVERKLDVSFHPDLSSVVAKGHVSGFAALHRARKIMRDSNAPLCLICATDSYINASSLNWLDRHWRLKTEENSDGSIPGEAAAALFVSLEPIQGRTEAAQVCGLGFARESAGVLNDEPLLGLGLASAARAALTEAAVSMHETHFRLSDVTGEHYGFKEHSLATARLMRGTVEDFPIWHPADAIGDTGAAAGLCQLVQGNAAFMKGYAPGSRGLCFTSSVRGERAVAILADAMDRE